MSDDSAMVRAEPIQWDAPSALQMVRYMQGIHSPHADLIVAWPLGSTGDRRIVYMAQHGEAINLADCGASVIEAVGWVAHRVRSRDPETDGERSYWRAVLIGPDMGLAASCSAGVIRALTDLTALLGPPPWQPPLNLRVIRGKGTGGRPWHTLEWLGDQL